MYSEEITSHSLSLHTYALIFVSWPAGFLLINLYNLSIFKREEFVVIHYEGSYVSQMARGYHKIVGKARVTGTTVSESWIGLILVFLSL